MHIPLYEKLRPHSLDEVVGHNLIAGDGGIFHELVKLQKPQSILLFGPPGCGKTTLAKIFVKAFNLPFKQFSCVAGSLEEIKQEIKHFQSVPLFQRQLILFLDEIHRLNKAQQDYFLPLIENGQLILIGATTENPSFHLNSALLSRLRVITLSALSSTDLMTLIEKVLKNYPTLDLSNSIKEKIIELSQGDGRHLLNLLDNLISSGKNNFTDEDLEKLFFKKLPRYDKNQDQHYQIISALHKSIRGSDPDAALYWLSRMLQAGEDREYILRRLTRIAIEDVGLADPHALALSLQAWETFHKLGSKEGDLAIAQTTLYLALCPKSVESYKAFEKAMNLALKTSYIPVPHHLINSVNAFSKTQGHGDGYTYEPETPLGVSSQPFLPTNLEDSIFYEPKEQGFEKELKRRKEYFEELKKSLKK